MTDSWFDKHKGGPDEHTQVCFCGRKATKHVTWPFGCGNVCGIHARSIVRNALHAKAEAIKA